MPRTYGTLRKLAPSLLLLVCASSAGRTSEEPKLYWTQSYPPKIMRANLDGSGVETLLSEADGLEDPRCIAVDSIDGRIYWANGGTPILRARLDGTDVETVSEDPAASTWGIDVHEGERKLYFSDSTQDRLSRCDLDGGNLEILVDQGQRNPIGVDVDATHGKVYWAISDEYSGVRRANLDGSDVADVVRFERFSMDVALDEEAGRLYFTDLRLGTVKSTDLDGAQPVTVTSGFGALTGVDVHDGWVYFGDATLGGVLRVAVTGGDPTVLVTGMNDVRSLAIFARRPTRPFARGDANADGSLNIGDPVLVLRYLFVDERRPSCLDALDADASGSIEITDAIALLDHLFLGRTPPQPPFPGCGTAVATELGCVAFPPCE